MNVQIDRIKTYTSGEWVHGTVTLHSSVFDVREVTVELWGTFSYTPFCIEPVESGELKLYSFFDRKALELHTIRQAGGKSFDIALRFPGHELDNYLMLPASIINSGVMGTYEIHHFITVNVLKQGPLAKDLQQTVEVEFMPSVSISRLLEPNVSYHMPSFGGLPLAATIHLPRFLTQGMAANTIKIKLLHSGKPEYELISLNVRLGLDFSIQGKSVINRAISMCRKHLSEELVEFVLPGVFDRCPAFSLSDVTLRYDLQLDMTVAEIRNREHHEIHFSKPVDLLPTLLYKSDRLDFARPDEIVAMSKLRGRDLISRMISMLTGDELDSTMTTSTMTSDDQATDATSPPK